MALWSGDFVVGKKKIKKINSHLMTLWLIQKIT